MSTRVKDYITTFSGTQFSLSEPIPQMVHIRDIAHHLAHVCRWAGATQQFYSVAQHSVIVSMIAPDSLKKWGLMHDAAEAYIGDITRPLKVMLPQVRVIEERIMHAVAMRFDLEWPEPIDLAQYDDQIQRLEAELYIFNHTGHFIDRTGAPCDIPKLAADLQLPSMYLRPMEPNVAEVFFADRFRELFR